MKPLISILWLIAFGAAVMPAKAQSDNSALIKTIQEQIQTLQRQLAELQAQKTKTATISVAPFAANLRRGSRDAEVKRLQEFFKAQPEFYPEGLVTGYFGVATERAVKRFQKTYGIPDIGIIGPQTRAKLNELLTAKAEPAKPEPPAPAPVPVPEPPTLTITPAPEPAPATTTPPAVATTTPAAVATTTPVISRPTQTQLGLPIVSFSGWGQDYNKAQFTHDPGNYTRSYAIYLRAPNQTADTKFGPYTVLPQGQSSTTADGVVFKRIGPDTWEWTKTVNLDSEPEGSYQISIIAVGDGNVESVPSPARISELKPKAEFEDLLQGAPGRAVTNSTFSFFPLTIRLKNYSTDFRYNYAIYDGSTKVWDSGLIRATTHPRTEVSFPNVNNYTFVSGKTYRLKVDAFDNAESGPSETKQKSGGIILTYSPY